MRTTRIETMKLLHQHQMPMRPRNPSSITLLAMWAICCLPAPAWAEQAEGKPMNTIAIEKDRFGTTADGVAVDRYTLATPTG